MTEEIFFSFPAPSSGWNLGVRSNRGHEWTRFHRIVFPPDAKLGTSQDLRSDETADFDLLVSSPGLQATLRSGRRGLGRRILRFAFGSFGR